MKTCDVCGREEVGEPGDSSRCWWSGGRECMEVALARTKAELAVVRAQIENAVVIEKATDEILSVIANGLVPVRTSSGDYRLLTVGACPQWVEEAFTMHARLVYARPNNGLYATFGAALAAATAAIKDFKERGQRERVNDLLYRLTMHDSFVRLQSKAEARERRPPDPPADIGNSPIATLRLGRTLTVRLLKAGVSTVTELTSRSEADLYQIPGMGVVRVEQVKFNLRSRGLMLAPERPMVPTVADMALLDIRIEDAKISMRTRDLLGRMGFVYVGDVVGKTMEDLRGLPRKCWDELRVFLIRHHFSPGFKSTWVRPSGEVPGSNDTSAGASATASQENRLGRVTGGRRGRQAVQGG